MASSLYINPATWDLTLDAFNNIAVCSDPYRLAQDAATAIKAFRGTVYYDTTQGVPWNTILDHLPPINYVRQQLVNAALTVVGVVSAQVFFTSFSNRILSGQVQVTDAQGNTAVAAF